MHWVYILKCETNIIYVGETTRLYRRLNEHCNKDSGSCTTHTFYPQSLLGIYKVEDYLKLINKNTDPIQYDLYEKGYLNENKTIALMLENTIAEMYMQACGPQWEKVFGGKYHEGYRPVSHPCKKNEFNRPFCHCKMPADIKEWGGKKYWRCAKKNIWNKLEHYVQSELSFYLHGEPCKFYKDYDADETFKCENLIYKYHINNGQCQILSDSEDD